MTSLLIYIAKIVIWQKNNRIGMCFAQDKTTQWFNKFTSDELENLKERFYRISENNPMISKE